MELSAGYQLTELGLIRNDWKISQVQDVCRLVNGRGFKPFEWSTQGLPIIRIQNLNGSGDFNYYNGDYDKKIEILTGQLLFAWSGSRGTSFGPHFWSGTKGVLNYHTWKVVVDEQAVDSKFFFYALKKLTEFIEERAHGASALVHTQKWEMETFKFPLPSDLNEQRAIAKTLSDVDALIVGLEKLISKKRDLKQAAMQQLLTGQTRLPGFIGEWVVKFLGDACRITTGAKDVNEGNPEGQFPFFTCSRSHTFSDVYSFDTEAILIAGNGEVGNLHYFNGKFEAYQRTYVLCDFSMHVKFLWHQLSANLATSLGLGKVGSSIPYIKRSNLTDFRFLCPPTIDEQAAIALTLTNMDTELLTLESRLAKSIDLKQGMMQELLTGRTRLI